MRNSYSDKSLKVILQYVMAAIRKGLFHLGTLCRITLFLQRQDNNWITPQTPCQPKPLCPSAPEKCGPRHESCGRKKCGQGCPMTDECVSLPPNPPIPPDDLQAKMPQYFAGLAATLGALAAGANLGWSAPVMVKITGNNTSGYDFPVTVVQGDWMTSIVILGAAFICYPIGVIMDAIGRKKTMLLLTIPFGLGWVLITYASSANMLIFGRFITGVAGGAFCVTAPAYTSEISQKSIRGTLGSFFHLLMTIGILLAFTIGGGVTIFIFNILCACVPIIFCCFFFFMPESPHYLVMKGRYEEARKALIRLRGKKYDVDQELNDMIAKAEAVKREKEKRSCFSALTRKTALRAILICYTLMFFQQVCGLNAFTFNAPRMFADAGIAIPWTISTIIIGINQVVATFLATLFIDKIGRRILLLLSSLLMGVCSTVVGMSFFLQNSLGVQNELVMAITWLPLVCLFLFLMAFSIGLGPIPWMMAGELCHMDIKAFVASTSGTLSWLLSFIGASTFYSLNAAAGTSQVFWMFALVMVVAFSFIYFIVPETKDKSIEEIQDLLGGPLNHRAREKKRILQPDNT